MDVAREVRHMDVQKAIEWMEDMQEYCKDVFRPVDREAADYIIAALCELKQYREAGTPDECRAAREKQVPREPERISTVGQGLQENDEGHMIHVNVQMDYYECQKCGGFLAYAGDCEDDRPAAQGLAGGLHGLLRDNRRPGDHRRPGR